MRVSQLFFLAATACTMHTASAFVILPQQPRAITMNTRFHQHLGEIDEMCIENAAAYCLDNDLAQECDLEEIAALVNTLQQQQKYHSGHAETIKTLLTTLKGEATEDTKVRVRHLNEIDEMCVENAATYCLDNDLAQECDLEEYEALVNTLQEQAQFHSAELDTINNLLSKIQVSA